RVNEGGRQRAARDRDRRVPDQAMLRVEAEDPEHLCDFTVRVRVHQVRNFAGAPDRGECKALRCREGGSDESQLAETEGLTHRCFSLLWPGGIALARACILGHMR